jgi:hypothetical protein
MRTRPNLTREEQEAVCSIGEILGRPVFGMDDYPACTMHDALELFQRALQEAAEDLRVA